MILVVLGADPLITEMISRFDKAMEILVKGEIASFKHE